MGNDISAGHTYSSTSPNNSVTASNLNEHVNGATLKATAISARTAKSSVLGAEEVLINDGGTLKKATVNALAAFIFPDDSVDKDKITPNIISGQTLKASPEEEDYVLIYDPDADALRKGTIGSISPSLLGEARGVTIKYASASTLTVAVSSILLLNSTGQAARHLAPGTQTVNIASSGANGLDTGAEASGTWYYVWGISNGTDFRGLISLSSSAPTMPDGFTYKLLLGVVRNDGSSNFVPFYQYGNNVFCEKVNVLTNTGPSNINTLQSLGIASAIPEIAVGFKATGYTLDADPDDWGIVIAGNSDGVGASVFAVDATYSSPATWFGGKRIFSFEMIPVLQSQTLFWTAKKTGDFSNIDITGYSLNLH